MGDRLCACYAPRGLAQND